MSPVELDWLHEQAKQYKTIVEIGSYRGRSTVALCDACPGHVYAVDVFRNEDYPIFLKNVGQRNNLTVMRKTSREAARRFKDKSIEMVFIDADHSYESCREDIALWLPKAQLLICGHDYTDDGQGHWPGVVRAVNERFQAIEKVETIWASRLT